MVYRVNGSSRTTEASFGHILARGSGSILVILDVMSYDHIKHFNCTLSYGNVNISFSKDT